MSKTSKDRIIQRSRAQFATLLYGILERCYPDSTERLFMLGRPAKYLFGVNLAPHEKLEISQSISGRMNQSNRILSVAGRELNNYCNEYRDNPRKDMVLGHTHYRQYLDFAFENEAELNQLQQTLSDRFGAAFPPADIRRLTFMPESDIAPAPPAPPGKTAMAEHIRAFARSNWYFYFYEYESPVPCLIRLVMKMELTDHACFVQLVNTGEEFATYKGEVVELTARRLRIELSGEEGKTMHFMAHMESSGDSEIYMGMFVKNVSWLVSCSVILHRIPDSIPDPKAEVFYLDRPETEVQVPGPIRLFFQKKEYVFSKVSKLYNLDALNAWLRQKQIARREDIVRHIFLAAPVGAYLYQHGAGYSGEQEKGAQYETVSEEAEAFKKEVFEFQDAMNRKFSIQSYFAPRNHEYYYRSPKNNLQVEWDEFCRSRALLLIVPARPLFSSCWVILGWAMARATPVFILCYGENGLPNMVRYADIHPNVEKINLSNQHHSIDDALEALNNNPKWRDMLRQGV